MSRPKPPNLILPLILLIITALPFITALPYITAREFEPISSPKSNLTLADFPNPINSNISTTQDSRPVEYRIPQSDPQWGYPIQISINGTIYCLADRSILGAPGSNITAYATIEKCKNEPGKVDYAQLWHGPGTFTTYVTVNKNATEPRFPGIFPEDTRFNSEWRRNMATRRCIASDFDHGFPGNSIELDPQQIKKYKGLVKGFVVLKGCDEDGRYQMGVVLLLC
ncbi:hypothetical protein TWF718_001680 [Orbilia javanica]|uniref:Uncharacterized protein n=1 Tax=Orbilia javanica TaxID=47235 RepID=A0AAN8MVM6_9PEZI